MIEDTEIDVSRGFLLVESLKVLVRSNDWIRDLVYEALGFGFEVVSFVKNRVGR